MEFVVIVNKKIIINDINNDLIELYKNIRDNPKQLIKIIETLLKSHSKEHFEQVKKIFNKSVSSVKKSAMFVYLNKTCFNGLCRYNKKGETITELYQYGPDRIERKNIAQENPHIVKKLLPLWEKGVRFDY